MTIMTARKPTTTVVFNLKKTFLGLFLLSFVSTPTCLAQPDIDQAWFPQAPPLERTTNDPVEAANVDQLIDAVENAQPGQTILVQPGVYPMPRYIEITQDGVTLAGATGNRHDVIIDGSQSRHGELIGFRACKNVTVANLTIQNIQWNGFKINAEDNVQNLTIYNCVIHNIWQRGVKSVHVPEENRERIRPQNIRIQYCLFYNDHPKRFEDDPRDTPDNFNGNYIGGIDAMFPKEWTISDNVFIGIQGRTREGRGCVFLWHHAEDCIIERNIIIDCDIGIALGNSSGIGEDQSSVHATGMIVRNNFITRTPETGILADYTRDCVIAHNTIYDPNSPMQRLLRVVHDTPGLQAVNNLFIGPGLSIETDDPIHLDNNRLLPEAGFFVDAEAGNLHLRANAHPAINQAIQTDFIQRDIDGESRNLPFDLGADEFTQTNSVRGSL